MSDAKPPLGLSPRNFWIEQRAWAIVEAMERYRRDGLTIPLEWADELAEHLKVIKEGGK